MAIHGISWDVTTFDTKPIGTSLLGQVDDYIKATRQATRMRFQPEHNFDMANDDMQGVHKEGSARVWVSDTNPTSPQPSYGASETNANKGRILVSPTNKTIQIHNGSAWVEVYTAADVLTKIKTVDGVGSGLDAEKWAGSAKTISTSDPAGGVDGDIWFKVV